MARAAALVLSLLGLTVSGYAFSQKGFHAHRGGNVDITIGPDYGLRAAGHTLLEAKASTGTFAATDLRWFHNLTLVRADEVSYCIQVGWGTSARHLAGRAARPPAAPAERPQGTIGRAQRTRYG